MRRFWIMLLAIAMALVIALPAGAGKPPIDCDKHPNHPECVTDPGDDTPIAGTTRRLRGRPAAKVTPNTS
jgi:hypothetical protein